MAITSPQATTFTNERVRVAADKLAQAYNFANLVINEWYALDMAALIDNDAGETVADGAATDGRPIITGAMVHNVLNRLIELRDDYDAGGSAKLNTILQVAVNPE